MFNVRVVRVHSAIEPSAGTHPLQRHRPQLTCWPYVTGWWSWWRRCQVAPWSPEHVRNTENYSPPPTTTTNIFIAHSRTTCSRRLAPLLRRYHQHRVEVDPVRRSSDNNRTDGMPTLFIWLLQMLLYNKRKTNYSSYIHRISQVQTRIEFKALKRVKPSRPVELAWPDKRTNARVQREDLRTRLLH